MLVEDYDGNEDDDDARNAVYVRARAVLRCALMTKRAATSAAAVLVARHRVTRS